MTVHTRDMKRPAKFEGISAGWPTSPIIPQLYDVPSRIMVGGIGGTGVVTIGALLGMAAHLEGKATRVMDMAGLAQKVVRFIHTYNLQQVMSKFLQPKFQQVNVNYSLCRCGSCW